MTASAPTRSTPALILKIIAGVVLVAAVLTTLSLVAAAQNLQYSLIPLQLAGMAPIADLFANLLRATLINAAALVGVLLAGIAGLLFGLGVLLGKTHTLAERVAALEARLAALEGNRA